MLFAVLLAGGEGKRLWPISRVGQEKHLRGEVSLLERTFQRVSEAVPAERVFIVTTQAQKDTVVGKLGGAVRAENVLAEPFARGTAAATLFAAINIARYDPNPVLIVLPCDHEIKDTSAFIQTIGAGLKYLAQNDVFVAFGAPARSPETRFGYVQVAEELKAPLGTLYAVKRFVEKPNATSAQSMLASGGVFWNTGIYALRARSLLNAAKQHLPTHYEAFMRIFDSFGTRAEEQTILETYKALPEISLDKALMEKVKDLVMVEIGFEWADVGGHAELPDLREAGDGNRAGGDFVALEAKNCVAWTDSGLVALLGVSGLTVVRCGDVVLVARSDAMDRLAQLKEKLKKAGLDRYA